MSEISGIKKPGIAALPQVQARMTFVYLERCTINREDGAITVVNDQGVVYLPAASVNVLLLGPGTSLTHRAVELIGDSGVSIVWVGEHGVRYYASGRPVTRRSSLLLRQAELVSNNRLHLEVVRKMYSMRFPGEDVSALTMQQLRGKEGARVRKTYRHFSKQYNVPWDGREYDVTDFSAGDPVNQALSAGNVCLYGLAASVIAALGCSNGLGFVHVGHELSFAYDLADLYKAETTIPLAFQLASEETEDIGRVMRIKTRDVLTKHHIAERMVRDIHTLFQIECAEDLQDIVYLWDKKEGTVPNGISYGVEGETFVPWEQTDDSDHDDPLSE